MSLKDVLRGELNSWVGLPTTETVLSLAEQLKPVDRVLESYERHRSAQRFTCTVFERPAAPLRVEAWVLYGAEHIALVECDDPPVLALEETLRRYGTPDMILSDQRFVADAMVREHIYARRGVAFSVAEPFQPANRAERRLVHLQLFPATTLERYLTDIGVSANARPKTNP